MLNFNTFSKAVTFGTKNSKQKAAVSFPQLVKHPCDSWLSEPKLSHSARFNQKESLATVVGGPFVFKNILKK